jgi:uncharacterized phage infection (PIP) family protein YhgE
MSPNDYKDQRLSRNEARKQISKIMSQSPGNARFSKHAIEELDKDGLTTADAINVLKSTDAKIFKDGEWENGNYRYRLETSHLLVVVGFWNDGTGLSVVTAWDKRKGRVKK